ncbi:proton-conducting transporter membrane subunit [Lacibacterium aquatile]|uniref:Proton-conducting transporter membrane subunit n=1 Tax=Lacibacterium aquatile TaxID=1168082 RepID=A0ABW5DNZ1_9PROT
MIPLFILPLFHLLAGLLFIALPPARGPGWLNLAASTIGGGLAIAIAINPPPGDPLLFLDALNRPLLALFGILSITTAVFSVGFLPAEIASGRLKGWGLRLYHPLFQSLLASLSLALIANNLGLLWAAVEAATLSTILMIALSRTEAALKAAWRTFILGGVGIALALFGTILIYIAAQGVVGTGLAAMTWSALIQVAGELPPNLVSLAFVVLLIGYGTKAGLVPMQSWLPDAHAEGPTPIAAVLSGLMLTVALYALVRLKSITGAGSLPPGWPLVALGLASVLAAGLMLPKRGEIRRFFATSSVEQIGLAAVAFGLGGKTMALVGLLLAINHMIAKSAVFFILGRALQLHGRHPVQALAYRYPLMGWSLVLLIASLLGLPPFLGFAPKVTLVSGIAAHAPLLLIPLVAGLLLVAVALVTRLNETVFARPQTQEQLPALSHGWTLYGPLGIHIGLLVASGLSLGPLQSLLVAAAEVAR